MRYNKESIMALNEIIRSKFFHVFLKKSFYKHIIFLYFESLLIFSFCLDCELGGRYQHMNQSIDKAIPFATFQ